MSEKRQPQYVKIELVRIKYRNSTVGYAYASSPHEPYTLKWRDIHVRKYDISCGTCGAVIPAGEGYVECWTAKEKTKPHCQQCSPLFDVELHSDVQSDFGKMFVGGKVVPRESEDMNDVRRRVVSSTKVAHVTFHLVKEDPIEGLEDRYLIYSEDKKRGMQQVEGRYGDPYPVPYNEALITLQHEIETLESILESKRKGPPTSKQLSFLFHLRIPIPLDLTWGRASELLDEYYAEEALERERARKEVEAEFLRLHPEAANRRKPGQ